MVATKRAHGEHATPPPVWTFPFPRLVTVTSLSPLSELRRRKNLELLGSPPLQAYGGSPPPTHLLVPWMDYRATFGGNALNIGMVNW